jgi:23S rRNA U2552 (ribose-2'-O)-methylase RlmE/FtsJ
MVEIIQLFHFFPKPSYKIEDQSTKNKIIENKKNLSYKKYFATSTHKKDFSDSPIKSFHLAEGPGGFIEAFVRTRENPQDVYIGITLLDEKNDANIPSWKKSATFLKENPNVFIENGIDGTGNILSVANFEGCVKKYGEGSMDFITGDGGFDFSMDFNNQEVYISKLLFAQITYALFLQKEGGTFVLKIFDVFMKHTVDMIAILSAFYDKVYITKPLTSRYANSEKYLVCIGYKEPGPFREILASCFRELVAHEGDYMNRFLSIPIPYHFIQKLEEYNAIFGQRQIQNINYTISLMSNKHKQDKIDELIKTNIQKSLEWCIKYDVPYYISNHSNIFNVGNIGTPPSRRLIIQERKEEH